MDFWCAHKVANGLCDLIHKEDAILVESKVKGTCKEATQNLIFKMQFPNHEFKNEMGVVYPQYQLNKEFFNVASPINLAFIKATFYIGRKTKTGVFVPQLFNLQQLDVQISFFQLTMTHNAKLVMAKGFNKNLISKLWMKINSSPILAWKLNEYNKLDEITLVQVLGPMENELRHSTI